MLQVRIQISMGDEVREKTLEIYQAGADFEYFVKKSHPVCRWASGFQVNSKLYFNEGLSPQEITRKSSKIVETGMGRDFGQAFFPGKGLDENLNRIFEIERGWELNPGQGGVFADRVHFSRYRAEHIRWKAGSDESCGHFKVDSEGYLDVGEVSTDFYSLPRTLSGDPEQIASFLNSLLPSGPDCPEGPSAVPASFPSNPEFSYNPVQH
jgi:hypothetical protein